MKPKILSITTELMCEINSLTHQLRNTNTDTTATAKILKQLEEKQELFDSYLEILNKKTYHFFVGGPPGAGKSAFVGELKDVFPYAEIIPSGNICRNLAKEDSERGHEVARFVKKGELVPLSLFVDNITEKLHNIVASTHIVIWDGFPRTFEQERLFAQYTMGGKVAKVLKDAPEEEIMGRILYEGRKQCSNPSCGVEHATSQTICNKCGSSLIVRPDDDPVIWLKRYRYHMANIDKMQNNMHADLSFLSNDREGHKNIIKAVRKTWGI